MSTSISQETAHIEDPMLDLALCIQWMACIPVPLFAWLGARIARLMPHTAANDNTLPIKDRHAA